ncbi:MAG: hypothetical protein JWP19_2176 [Rhodoglobus sp.]|nr:hypothetical protein [Rhodoglobus sp.]
METNRWTKRFHDEDRDAERAAARTTDVMARILEDLRMLDSEELGLRTLGQAGAPEIFASRVG